jgi:hypothetical protein
MPETVRALSRTTLSAAPPPPVVARPFGGRRSPLRLVGGVLLTAVVVLTFVTVDLRADHKREVLAVTGPVAAGQVLTGADVTSVAVAAEAGVPLLAASHLADVVGRTAAVPLVRGELLSAGLLGPAAFPPAGEAVLAVDVKPGHAPAGLEPGTPVLVLVTAVPPASGGPAPPPVSTTGSVIAVDLATDGSGDLAVSLLTSQIDAVALAADTGDVSLILTAPAN